MNWIYHNALAPAENLAWEEALLHWAEENKESCLRVWSSPLFFVALGYANSYQTEANAPFCRSHNIPILRRISGGGTVLQGPGCLNFSLILRMDDHPEFQSVTKSHRFILTRITHALEKLGLTHLALQGESDLTWQGKKFSGNAQRRQKNFFLHHGTLLCGMDFEVVEHALHHPSREPAYRAQKSHRDFLVNLSLPASELIQAIQKEWKAEKPFTADLSSHIKQLCETRYEKEAWNQLH